MLMLQLMLSLLVGGLEHLLCFHILGTSSSQLTNIFQGVETTNQIMLSILFSRHLEVCGAGAGVNFCITAFLNIMPACWCSTACTTCNVRTLVDPIYWIWSNTSIDKCFVTVKHVGLLDNYMHVCMYIWMHMYIYIHMIWYNIYIYTYALYLSHIYCYYYYICILNMLIVYVLLYIIYIDSINLNDQYMNYP